MKNLENDISRDSVAKAVGLTPAYFGKVFKATTGVTFFSYLFEQRMKHAQNLLAEGIKISDVCSKIGMNDEHHFRKVFKMYCGMTPTEYRKAVEERGD